MRQPIQIENIAELDPINENFWTYNGVVFYSLAAALKYSTESYEVQQTFGAKEWVPTAEEFNSLILNENVIKSYYYGKLENTFPNPLSSEIYSNAFISLLLKLRAEFRLMQNNSIEQQ